MKTDDEKFDELRSVVRLLVDAMKLNPTMPVDAATTLQRAIMKVHALSMDFKPQAERAARQHFERIYGHNH